MATSSPNRSVPLKTRPIATQLCEGGHVRVNGRDAKASTRVKAGDRVQARIADRDREVEVVTVIESRVGAPIAVACGIFLAEFGQNRLGTILRFLVDVLAGMPSITIGLFLYGLVVLPNRQFMAIAGALALAIILLPIVARVTEEMTPISPAPSL